MTKQELISFTKWLGDNYSIAIPDMALQNYIKHHTEDDKSAFKVGDNVRIIQNSNSEEVRAMNDVIGEVGEVTNTDFCYEVLGWQWLEEDLELVKELI